MQNSFEILSKSKHLTPRFIEKYIDKPWDFTVLSKNPIITPEFIEKHINKPWEWGGGYKVFQTTQM